jgi:hypothetical protein
MGRLREGPSRTGAKGAYLDRYVTDEQRSSRPIFNATLRAAASWLFFRVARSTVMIQIAALRSRLEKQPTDLRRSSRDLGDGTLGLHVPNPKISLYFGQIRDQRGRNNCHQKKKYGCARLTHAVHLLPAYSGSVYFYF